MRLGMAQDDITEQSKYLRRNNQLCQCQLGSADHEHYETNKIPFYFNKNENLGGA